MSADTKALKVGVVSLRWPPSRGGTQIYGKRLADSLHSLDVDVAAVTAFAGDKAEITPYPLECFNRSNWNGTDEQFTRTMRNEWWTDVINWAVSNKRTHLLVNSHFHCEDSFVKQCERINVRPCLILHDYFPDALAVDLYNKMWTTRSWDSALAGVLANEEQGATEYHKELRLLAEPWSAFVISTKVMSDLVQFSNRCPRYVLHPLIDSSIQMSGKLLTPRTTIGAVNPLLNKGGLNLAGMAWGAPPEWTFRIVVEGWGNAAAVFLPMVREISFIKDRLYIDRYLPSVADLFSSCDLYLCPSLVEGYGMAPVEALYAGTPVVATDFPTIREGLGDGAKYVPYFGHAGNWIDAAMEVLDNRSEWLRRGKQRKEYLIARQSEETTGLVKFIAEL